MGIQLSIGRGTFGITGFLMGIPGSPPPMEGGGGAIGTPEMEEEVREGRKEGPLDLAPNTTM